MFRNFFLTVVLTCTLTTLSFHSVGGQFFIDPHIHHVEKFDGWGTSLAWWADVLGGMSDDIIEVITDEFFLPDRLNLNIVRYVIGGTTPGNYTCGKYRPGAATESYWDGPGRPFNWTRDERQRKILQIAKDKGVDVFEAFSNSPPQWMTITGCSKGNLGGGLLHGNFASAQAENFAAYIVEVLLHFSQDWNIKFSSYAPFNEPYGLQGLGGWLGPGSTQEGCNMDQAVMADTIRAMFAAFQAQNISTILSVADETQVNTAVMTQTYFRDQNLTDKIGKVNVHGYWDSADANRDKLYRNSLKDGHKLWMDEMGWGATFLDDMEQGLNIANRIVTDLRNMMPSAWVYWQVLEDVEQWGLLSIPYEEPSLENITYNSGYYSMMQFSRYIKKGSIIIHSSDPNSVAAYHPDSSELVLVLVNGDEATTTSEFSLKLFQTVDPNFVATRTSTEEQNAEVSGNITLNGSTLTAELPPESITTIVFRVTLLASMQNLVINGDFESGLDSWEIEGTVDVIHEDTWRGLGTALVTSGTLQQTWVVERDGVVYLTCWCATTGQGATLRLEIDGIATAVPVANKHYRTYSLASAVRAGQKVTLAYQSGSGESFIDDVVVHMV